MCPRRSSEGSLVWGVHILQIYEDANWFLRGFLKAIEAFQSDQDPEGWRVQNSTDFGALLEFGLDTGKGSPLDVQGDYLLLTPVTSELLLHIEALQTLFEGEQPLMIPICPTDREKLR